MKREDLIPGSAMDMPIVTAAAVGSSSSWNDDLYSASGTMTISSGQASVSNPHIVSQLNVYPNPSNGIFHLDTRSSVQEVRIFDYTGKLVKTINDDPSHIDMTGHVAGIYFITVQTEETTYSSKIILD